MTHLPLSAHLSIGRRKTAGEGTSCQVFPGAVVDRLQPGMLLKQRLGTQPLSSNIQHMLKGGKSTDVVEGTKNTGLIGFGQRLALLQTYSCVTSSRAGALEMAVIKRWNHLQWAHLRWRWMPPCCNTLWLLWPGQRAALFLYDATPSRSRREGSLAATFCLRSEGLFDKSGQQRVWHGRFKIRKCNQVPYSVTNGSDSPLASGIPSALCLMSGADSGALTLFLNSS